MPIHHDSPEELVEATLARVGPRVVLGTPLALGKPCHLVNAFYRAAEADPSIELVVYTALSLAAPGWSNELERRLIEPLAERVFGGYPQPAWVEPMRRDALPANVEVREFYFQPGAMLGSPAAQRSYVSSNYTHVVRDVLDAGIDVLAQAVSAEVVDGEERYSLSCNSDLTVDLLPRLARRREEGEEIAVVGQVNRNLPFLYGDAMIAPDELDAVVDRPELEFPLFGPPNEPLDTVDYLVALHVSALVRDGGTLQIGIGSLGDAIVRALQLRHEENAAYRELLDDVGALAGEAGRRVERWGGVEPFERGLYAASEMLVDGFLELYDSGILARRVYPDAGLQRLLDAGRCDEAPSEAMLAALVEEGLVGERPTAAEVARLRELGVLRASVRLDGGELVDPDRGDGEGEERVPADLSTPEARRRIAERFLGAALAGGRLAHAAFFLGPRAFYERLGGLPRAERELFEMTGISRVNELYGDEELKRAQRRHARFVNTAMKVTLGGAAVSDGLADGRVVSGVGGQYNFVAMAHALEGGRSILMVRSTRQKDGDIESNVVWSYGHVTIPRHLRDLVVTEYGVADLRGRTDEEVATALIEVADARFQRELLEEARRAGKVGDGYRIPDRARTNRRQRLEDELAAHREAGRLPRLPFGSDLSEEELTLAAALSGLASKLRGRDLSVLPGLDELRHLVAVPDEAEPYLRRMGLAEPEGLEEAWLARAVVYALSLQGVL